MSVIGRLKNLFLHNTTPKQTVLKNTFWVMVAEFISKGSLALVIIIIGREFGKEIFGQYSYFTIILAFLLLLADVGITQLTIRDWQHLGPEQRKHYLNQCLQLKAVLTGIVLIIYAVLLYFMTPSYFLLSIATALLFNGIATSFLEYFRATFRSIQRSETETKIKLFQGVLNLLLIPLLYSTYSLPRVLFGQCVITTLTVLYAWILFKKKSSDTHTDVLSEHNNFSKKRLLTDGVMFALSGLFVSMYYYLDSIVIQRYRGYEAVGVYNAAYKIITILIVPLSIIGGSLMPTIRALNQTNNPTLCKSIRRFTRTTGVCYTIAIFVGIIFAHQFIEAIYGPMYAEAGSLFQILLLTVIVIARYTPIARSLYALNLQKRHMIATGIGLSVNATLNIIMIPIYGISAAAWTTLATELLAASIMVVVFLRFRTGYQLQSSNSGSD